MGYKGPVKMAKSELNASNLVASRSVGDPRTSAQDFRVGDVLTFLIEETADAFGDTVLSSGARPAALGDVTARASLVSLLQLS